MGPSVPYRKLRGTDLNICSLERHAERPLQAVGYLVGNLVVVSVLWYVLWNENARRDRGERDHRLKDVGEGVLLGDDDPRWRYQT